MLLYYNTVLLYLSTKNSGILYNKVKFFFAEGKALMEEIQKKLRNAIKTSGKTYKEIAKAASVTPSAISNYMHRDEYPSLDTFARICKFLDVSADEILGLT